MKPKKATQLLFLGIFSLLLAGCELVQMRVPRGLENSEMELEDTASLFREKHLKFGPWLMSEVDRDWTSSTSSSWSLILVSKSEISSRQGYRFVLNKSGQPAFAVECLTAHASSEVDIGLFTIEEGSTFLSGRVFRPDGKTVVASLNLPVSGSESPGRIDFGGRSWSVAPEYRTSQGNAYLDHSGFVLRAGSTAIAAVQTVNKARIWLSSSLPEEDKDMAAALLCALALYKDIGKESR